MAIRRVDPISQPVRWAQNAQRTHFDAREWQVPQTPREIEAVLGGMDGFVGSAGAGGPDTRRIFEVAMAPDERDMCRAIELIGQLPSSMLDAYEGQLFALFQVLLLRREPARTLLTPPVEAFLRHITIWPERKSFPDSVANAPTHSWLEEVRVLLRLSNTLEDPAYPVLLEILERFPSVHSTAMRRLGARPAPSLAAARHIASSYHPSVIPLVTHEVEEIAEEARSVASVWLDSIELPLPRALERFRSKSDLSFLLGETNGRLVSMIVQEHRPELFPRGLGNRAADLLWTLYRNNQLEYLEVGAVGHQFLILAATRADEQAFDATLLDAVVDLLSHVSSPPKLMAELLDHPLVDEDHLERILTGLIEKGTRVIDQSRRLSDPLFAHHRPAFRRIMREGYRRTIGAPYLVEAVFMATPPESLQESIDFMLANHARSLPRLVRRWIDAHPEGTGNVILRQSTLDRMQNDSNASLALAGTLLQEMQDAKPIYQEAGGFWDLDAL